MKVSHVKLHKALHVPTVLEFQRTISQQFYPGIKMEVIHAGILCEYKAQNGKDARFIIPFVDTECIVLEDSHVQEDSK